jgi:hypothetical protein
MLFSGFFEGFLFLAKVAISSIGRCRKSENLAINEI